MTSIRLSLVWLKEVIQGNISQAIQAVHGHVDDNLRHFLKPYVMLSVININLCLCMICNVTEVSCNTTFSLLVR